MTIDFSAQLQSFYSRYGVKTVAAFAVLLLVGMSLLIDGALSFVVNRPQFTPLSESPAVIAPSSVKENKSTLPFSVPTSISIPRIDVNSDIISLGKNNDGSVAVPLGKNVNKTAWYKHSPTPGQIGSSVIIGHLDQFDGTPSSFFRLGELQRKDKIVISRADKSKVTFEVMDKQKVEKNKFPTEKVYTHTSVPTLQLITCGGWYDNAKKNYDSNIIVTAVLVD